MRTERLQEIRDRAEKLQTMDEIPSFVAGKLPSKYAEHVPALLFEIDRLQKKVSQQAHIIHGKDNRIDALHKDIEALLQQSPPASGSTTSSKRPYQTTINNIGEQ